MPVDSRAFRNALGCFATGITVVTAQASAGGPIGITINSFSSVSLHPPLILFCIDRAAFCFDVFQGGPAFAVNVLREDQEALSVRFASAAADRWDGVPHRAGRNGCPLLEGCLAHLECDTEALHEGGDHMIVVGRVTALDHARDGDPLLYFRGRYKRIDRRA